MYYVKTADYSAPESRFNKYHDPHSGKFSHGGAGGYTPGAWKVEHIDYNQRVTELAARLERDTSGWVRERAEETAGPDWARKTAEEMLDFSAEQGSGTVYRNGEHAIAFESTKVSAARQKQFLDEVDNLQRTAPVDRINIRVQPGSKFSWDTGGETVVGKGDIRISERVFTDYDERGLKYDVADKMPAARTVKASTYVLHHEWGHGVDNQSDGAPLDPSEFDLSGMSGYGQGDGYEQYAEAFAEWSITKGTTSVPAAREYADLFKWGERWPSLATTSKAA